MARFTQALVCIRDSCDFLTDVKDHLHQLTSVIFSKLHILNVTKMCCQKLSSLPGIVIHCSYNLIFLPWIETGGILKSWTYDVGVLPCRLKYIIDRSLTTNDDEYDFGTSFHAYIIRGRGKGGLRGKRGRGSTDSSHHDFRFNTPRLSLRWWAARVRQTAALGGVDVIKHDCTAPTHLCQKGQHHNSSVCKNSVSDRYATPLNSWNI